MPLTVVVCAETTQDCQCFPSVCHSVVFDAIRSINEHVFNVEEMAAVADLWGGQSKYHGNCQLM